VIRCPSRRKCGQHGTAASLGSSEEFILRECDEWGREREVRIHLGLAEWVKLNDRIEADVTGYGLNGTGTVIDRFEELTGMTYADTQRAYERIHRLPKVCPECGAGIGKAQWKDGYPGEAFLVCRPGVCGHIWDTTFDESAII
jgi:hypothetical protein